jgi:hypothetical protein
MQSDSSQPNRPNISPNPSTATATVPHPNDALQLLAVEPWPDPVDGKLLLDALACVTRSYVVMSQSARDALALFVVHTYAFQLHDVTTYVGIESPQKRCGKSTLLNVLSALVNRPLLSSNISPPALFRVIEELQPTLLIDEADNLLRGNEELRGILNSGYHRPTAFVMRVANLPLQNPGPESEAGPPATQASRLAMFSSWCPKAMAAIGHLPETLADRCILIRMRRKTASETCERLRTLKPLADPLKRQCARFVLDHSKQIVSACPAIPPELNDRAADIWEPLFAIADLAGGDWPQRARQAALGLTEATQERSPIGSLLLDILVWFRSANTDRLFTRALVAGLNSLSDRFWADDRGGKPITDLWLAQQLRPFEIRSRSIRIGDITSKGYVEEDFTDAFKRYIPRSEIEALKADLIPAAKAE